MAAGRPFLSRKCRRGLRGPGTVVAAVSYTVRLMVPGGTGVSPVPPANGHSQPDHESGGPRTRAAGPPPSPITSTTPPATIDHAKNYERRREALPPGVSR